eukprot:2212222-Pyramimonas_sp.AAC.1
MLCAPLKPCGEGHYSAGIAIFARVTVGLRWPGALPRGVAVSRRLIFAAIDIPGWPPILAGCA